MQVQSVEIKNFKAIGQEKINCNGRNVFVIGSNGAGKSSFLDAIFKGLTGKDMPSKLVKEGEKQGNVKIDLGDIVVEMAFNAKTEKATLTLTSPDGAKYPSPRTMLDQKIGVLDFDLNAFFNLTPKKKVEFMKQLCGVDFTDLDAEYKRLFDERTYKNRQVKELSAVVDSMAWDSSKTERIDLIALTAELEKANAFNQQRIDVDHRTQERQATVLSLTNRNNELLLEIEQNKARILENEGLVYKATRWLNDNPEVDTWSIKTQFDTAIEHNAEVDKTLRAQAELEKLKAAEIEQATLNEQLEEIARVKHEQIANCTLPVPGLTFDEEGLYLNGLPFEREQINTAQLIIAGLQINLALMKDVRIARFDGSLLDNKSLKQVEAWAEKEGLQLFVEIVQRDGEGMQIVVSEEVVREEVLA